ncbi:MAG: UbiA family prenyltransferase [Candidatus Nanohalobium sp.]
MKRWRLLAELVRPPFAVFTFWVLAAGVVTTGSFSVTMLPTLAAFTVLGHLAVFSLNDYFDRDSDADNDRKGGLEGAVVTGENENFVKYVAAISHVLLLGLAAFLPVFSFLGSIAVVVASFLYSAPPFRLKERPFLDSACNIVILYATFCIGVGLAGGFLDDVIPGAFWFALIFGGPGHMAASYVDRESDMKSDIMTSAVVLGRRGIVLLGQALLVMALILQSWSMETRTLLGISLLFSFYPLVTEKNMKKMMYLWAGVCSLYIVYWLLMRI